MSLTFSACGGGSESSSLPIILDAPIAYVKRPIEFDNNGNLIPINLSDPIAFSPGGDLFVRDRAAASSSEKNITSSFTTGMGDVKDVEFSHDGTRVIFAMRAPDILNAQPEDQPKWDIWEYNIETDNLRRIISDEGLAQEHHDVSPHYLPDGQIIFASSRRPVSEAIMSDELKPPFAGGVVENNANQKALVLHRMSDTGTNLTELSFNQSHDFNPIVLNSGRVLFSRWDNMGGQNAVNLYSINPDGTDLQLVYGAHSHDTGSPGSTIQFMKISEQENGEILSVLTPFNGTSGAGIITSIDTTNFIDNTSPNWANQGLITTAQNNLINTNIVTDGSPSPGGLYSSAYPLRDGTNRYFVSWTPCRLQDVNNTIIPCSTENLANVNNVPAPPLFGLFMYDASNNTQVPVVQPVEGIMFTNIAAATPRSLPYYIADKSAGNGLEQSLIDENVGIINIRSVYDVDGTDTAPGGIPFVSDPLLTTADQRPARFLRIVKAVSIPNAEDDIDGDPDTSLDNSAFGVSTAQGMREIIGYAPIEPDGSVKVKVPGNTAIAISVLDKDGKRIGSRHQNWIQVRTGETITCNGCHDHSSGQPHARPDGPPSINTGAPSNGYIFPNSDPNLWADTYIGEPIGETMAEARTRHDPLALTPSVDIKFNDVWTDDDPMGANLPKAAPIQFLYADLTTPSSPATTDCQTLWKTTYPGICRTVINYETHIHPLWSISRTNTAGNSAVCIDCHNSAKTTNPLDTQLDLTDGFSDLGGQNHFKAYRELLSQDNEQYFDGSGLSDVFILVDVTDPITGITTQQQQFTVLNPPMSTQGALASGAFFNRFNNAGDATHNGALTPAELKLLAEWLDIGAQYYNNPFAVDPARFIN